MFEPLSETTYFEQLRVNRLAQWINSGINIISFTCLQIEVKLREKILPAMVIMAASMAGIGGLSLSGFFVAKCGLKRIWNTWSFCRVHTLFLVVAFQNR